MEAQNKEMKVYNLVVVDESGSMSCIRKATLDGINETIATCQQIEKTYPQQHQLVTLVTFDSGHYKVHLDNVSAKEARMLTMEDYRPGGGTPLYDSIGRSVSMLDARVKAGDKVLVTILTDGMENCSTEFDLQMVNNLIEKRKAEGWVFALIGTDNLDVEGMGKDFGIGNTLKFEENEKGTGAMWQMERSSRMNYARNLCMDAQVDASVDYFVKEDSPEEDKK